MIGPMIIRVLLPGVIYCSGLGLVGFDHGVVRDIGLWALILAGGWWFGGAIADWVTR